MWIDIKYAPKDGTSILAKVDGYVPCVVEWVEYGGESHWSIPAAQFLKKSTSGNTGNALYEPTHFIFYRTTWMNYENL